MYKRSLVTLQSFIVSVSLLFSCTVQNFLIVLGFFCHRSQLY